MWESMKPGIKVIPFRSTALDEANFASGPNYGIGLAVNTPHARQKITLQEAVNAYTEGSAFLLNRECCMGRIQEGYFADLVIQGEKYVSETKVIGTRKPVATIRGGILTFGTWESIGSNS